MYSVSFHYRGIIFLSYVNIYKVSLVVLAIKSGRPEGREIERKKWKYHAYA